MLIVTVQVNAPAGQAIGIKEDLAMYLERWGDARVVSVKQRPQPQMEQIMLPLHCSTQVTRSDSSIVRTGSGR